MSVSDLVPKLVFPSNTLNNEHFDSLPKYHSSFDTPADLIPTQTLWGPINTLPLRQPALTYTTGRPLASDCNNLESLSINAETRMIGHIGDVADQRGWE
ncbi:hypothetical protein JTE90_007972 [Oedothorax gibbosus]|uniref:Uncharacterized protein n=1 Tax=Oedothorax gibbosus TaxID=931172 RepID=A0AAV6UMU7_9ARAC|nr:hypothetical protein JTE90_007972 [Oedothorax gibbosus]